MSAWPETLPQEPLTGLGLNPNPDCVIRNAMEGGPARQRRRYSGAMYQVSVSFMLTDQQVLVFRNFYENTIKRVGRFDFTDPNGGTPREFRFAAVPQIPNIEGGENGDPDTLPGTSSPSQSIWQINCTLDMFI